MSKLVWRSFCGKIVKNTVSWTYVISDFSGEKIFGKFFKNDYKKEIQKSFGLKKQLKENEINYNKKLKHCWYMNRKKYL